MTLQERANDYAWAFPEWPASHLRVVQEQGQDVLYGTWLLGNDYRNKTRYYGAYPPGYLNRVMALFEDAPPTNGIVLHAFSGSLPQSGDYATCDMSQPADFQCRVEALPTYAPGLQWQLVLADPPYSEADAVKYGTPMIDRRKVLSALAQVTQPSGHLVYLDTCWPMHRKDQWRTVGRITIIRSTNHRVRLVSIFERVPSPFVCGKEPRG